MTKSKIFILITLTIIAGFLIYCWVQILTDNVLANWRHYTGLFLFLPLIYFYFKNLPKAIVGTGIYLLFGIGNLLSLTVDVETSWLRIGPVTTPPFQSLSLELFVLYFFLNIASIINIQLDHNEKQAIKPKKK